jgi:hypothetical protein
MPEPGALTSISSLKAELKTGETGMELNVALPTSFRTAGLQYRLTIGHEIVLVENKEATDGKTLNGTKASLTRNAGEGSKEENHPAGSTVFNFWTKEMLEKYVEQKLTSEAWKLCSALGFENSWVEFEAGHRLPEYRKDVLGCVELRGIIKGGASATSAFTLPVGYRPPAAQTDLEFNGNCGVGNLPCGISVASSGTVAPSNTVTGGEVNKWVYLNGVRFSTV